MESAEASPLKRYPLGLDETSEEEYSSQSTLLQDFASIPTIDKAWTFTSTSGSQCMFSISQSNLLANKNRRYILSSHISKGSTNGVSFQWAAFPIEMPSGSIMVPSPSGSKLLVVRNPENDSPTKFEIWSPSQVEKEFHVPLSVHGSVYSDGWFEGISWNNDENFIAYVAEGPTPSKPVFNHLGYKKGNSTDKECGSWKGQGDWEEDWGETYPGKTEPAIFVIDVNSGEVHPVEGTRKLSVGQVVWAPASGSLQQYLVFVGWPSDTRKLGIKYCYNRPCALYAVRAPFSKSEDHQSGTNASEEASPVKLTQRISSAFFPRFSPDGKALVFLSAKSSVDSWVHSATQSLHRIDWSPDVKPSPDADIVDVVPVVMCPEDGCFPGLYCFNLLRKPWLSDGYTMILSSVWGSTEVILSVNVLSGKVSRISPENSNFSWSLLALDGNNIVAVCSSPADVPEIKYGSLVVKSSAEASWSWLDISSPIYRCSEKVISLLSSCQFSIIKIPVRDDSGNLTKGAGNPYEAIFVSSKSKSHNLCDPLIVVLHGGPHFISLSSFSKSLAFLSSIGYSLLIVNYRGSLGFGEEALQSLPGKIGSQDVNDVLAAIDHAVNMGLADPAKIAVLGGSHGGFLTTHLIGQAPDKFAAAATRNPVCSLPLMVGTADIPDWCYAETFGKQGKLMYAEAPSSEHLAVFHSKSPISHISKVKTPILFLLGAKDLRVPICTGLQYARALKEKGTEVKVLVFPEDNHAIDRPQSDFESFLNIGVWFKKHCK
ncbi:acylamino-acid-releasing enzyme [Nicotiana tabacum]|uniref:acylaminoacyl-peptidase n=1 Tax=Nicotiana tabacum TaxID=4097 RepID=A0A1S4BR06_TOBAC|nr:acylamino-acid-releasing enzyme-like isoform X1 [Nicotiana tomentosiformis]XP_016491324.1 PREDICTED: acylamino-acid-releasing enzyme-like isoform X1 [Nicotiana tabacum]